MLIVSRMARRPVSIGSVTLRPFEPTLIAPFTDRTPLSVLRKARARGLALLEARVDLFDDSDTRNVANVLQRAGTVLPVLVTPRWSEQGGHFAGDEQERLAVYRALLPLAAAVDVELDAPIRAEVVRAARRARRPVVLSHHDFAATPSAGALDRIVRRSHRAGADITKIAVELPDDEACARLAALFARHPGERLVVIGMGPHGKKTRVLFPALGSLFSFVSLGRATAPGQLELDETLAELARYYPDFSPE